MYQQPYGVFVTIVGPVVGPVLLEFNEGANEMGACHLNNERHILPV